MGKLNHTGTDRLRKGRVSIPGARYFITACNESREQGLHLNPIRESLIKALRSLHQANDIELHCATVMPDHLHSLFTLGCNLTLSQTQAKFKRLTKEALKSAALTWQENYYDHRIRHGKYLEPFARYIFLNPYRKRLIDETETWPGWVLNKHYRPEFVESLTDCGGPPAEWLKNTKSAKEIIDLDMVEDSE